MGFSLDFVDDYPEITPDPVQANMDFSVDWKVVNEGDEPSPSQAVLVQVSDSTGTVISSISGRDVVPLDPGDTDEDTIDVGALGPGEYVLTVTIGDPPNALVATIPLTVN